MFLRRNRPDPGNPRVLVWRVALFFLAAGIWLAGVIVGDTRLTALAIVILFIAILLRLIGRSNAERDEAHGGEAER